MFLDYVIQIYRTNTYFNLSNTIIKIYATKSNDAKRYKENVATYYRSVAPIASTRRC